MGKRLSPSSRSAPRWAAGAAAAALAWTFATDAFAQQQQQTQQDQGQVEKGRVENIKVHGRSLEGNLSGESPDRDVSIYLPPGYDGDTSRRYPVVYLLHGYSLTNQYWIGPSGQGFGSIDVPGAMDRDIASGKSRPMILVMPNGDSKYDGSMYSNSVTSGNWEGFIADDLVAYVDSHYRTIADRKSRGLAGHSMGGYGTIRIGMKRPDAFSSLYILSACCLMNDATAMARRTPPNASRTQSGQQSARSEAASSGGRGQAASSSGEGEASSSASASASSSASASARNRNTGNSNAGNSNAGNSNAGNRNGGGGFANVLKAEAAAWSPNPKNPPDYFDMPGGEGPEAALVAAKWAANSPLAMIDQYIGHLRMYSGIGMDVGRQDGLAASNEQLANVLAAYDIDHVFETYEGNHVNRIAERMEQKVLPFFSQHLDFDGED